jgi:hypothetical protein
MLLEVTDCHPMHRCNQLGTPDISDSLINDHEIRRRQLPNGILNEYHHAT